MIRFFRHLLAFFKKPTPPPGPVNCCQMRRKVVIGLIAILPESECGIPDSVMSDFLDFEQKAAGQSMIQVAYCAWCGARRGKNHEKRICLAPFKPDESGEEWKQGQTE